MDAILILEVSVALVTGGSILACTGLILLYLALRHVSTVKLPPTSGSIEVEAEPIDEIGTTLNSLVEYNVENGIQHLVIEWTEKNGKDVAVTVCERTEVRIGVKQRTYAEGTASRGKIETDLSNGPYLISFASSDSSPRTVQFTTVATEQRMRFKEHQPIALAMLTIGAVLLVNGLVLYIRI
jgi:hypothetical protein